MMLVVSLFGALRVFRRFRRRVQDDAGGGESPDSLLSGPAAQKLLPIWAGFGRQFAEVIGAKDDELPSADVPAAPPREGPAGPFVAMTIVTPWALLAMVLGALCFERGSTVRSYAFLGAMSGLVGYWTNWVAIRLLFKPTRPRFGFGVIPANRGKLIRRLASAIETHLVNPDVLASWLREKGVVADAIRGWHRGFSGLLESGEFRVDLKRRLSETGRLYLSDDAFRSVLTERVTAAARSFFREKLWTWVVDLVETPVLDRIKAEINRGFQRHGDEIVDDLVSRLDRWLDGFGGTLTQSLPELEAVVSEQIVTGLRRIDIRALVEKQLSELDEGELERLIHEATRNELAAVEVLGGVLGLLIGLLMPLFI